VALLAARLFGNAASVPPRSTCGPPAL